MTSGVRGCAVVVGGVAAGVLVDGAMPVAAALVVASVGLALASGRRRLLWVTLAAVAVAHGAAARQSALRPPDLAGGEAPRVMRGVLLSDASMSHTGVRLDLRVDGVRVRATVAGDLALQEVGAWTRGRTLVAPVRLRRPDLVRNPGSPSEWWQRLSRRADLVGTIKSAALVEVMPGPWWEELAAVARAHVRRTMATYLDPHASSSSAVVTAILIGDRAGLDDSLTRRLQMAGTFHVIAISGGNIAMLTVGCLVGLRLVVRGSTLPLPITMIVVGAYGLTVGSEPSVTRAVVAALLYLGLRLAGLTPQPLSLLAVVAALSVVWAPLTVTEAGAWLSFGATFGLIVVLPRLLPATRGPVVWSWLCAGVLATVAAEIVILPIGAGLFGRLTVAGLVLNLVAIPAMAVAQFAGLLLCALGSWGEPLTQAVAVLAHAAVVVLLGSPAALDIAPVLSWRVPPMSLWWTVAYYAALAVVLTVRSPRLRHVMVGATTAIAVVLATAPTTAWRRPPAGWLRVSMLDVGQGDATLVQTPSRHTLLVDAGGSPAGTFDVGGRIVTPALWALGERRLDRLVLTHGDLDHVGGAPRVIEDFRPREIWEGVPVEPDPAMTGLVRLAQATQTPWRRVQAGDELELGAVRVTVRHPPAADWQRPRVRNDDSVVIEVRYGDVAVWLTGDAGVEYEAMVQPDDRAGRPPRIRILKVAHHGSRSSTGAAYLARVNPHVAAISAGASNLFGHPAPDVMHRLHAQGSRIVRTDRDGAILIETDGRQVRLRTMTGRTIEIR